MANANVDLTLDDAVKEVLGMLTGLDLQYDPDENRYRAIVRQINRALRAHALEQEWAYYHSLINIGHVQAGIADYTIPATLRPRIIGDDAVRLVDDEGNPHVWAYFLPRDALHKYHNRDLAVAQSRSSITFSRPLQNEALSIVIPVMREPVMFEIPENSNDPFNVDQKRQLLDYDYPDVVLLRAAYYVAQSDPVMQPRAQTLEAQFKDIMYQLIERNSRNTQSPYVNEFNLDIGDNVRGLPHPVNTPWNS